MRPNPADRVTVVALVALAAGITAFFAIIRKAQATISEADDWGIKYAELENSGYCEAPNGTNIFWRLYKTFNNKYRFVYRMEGQDTTEELISQDTADEALAKGMEATGC